MATPDHGSTSTEAEVRNHANLIWSVAELLRGDYEQAHYGKVILPPVVMRRLDQMLEPDRDAVIAKAAQLEQMGIENRSWKSRRRTTAATTSSATATGC